jgi:hypothetical protein
MSKNHAVKKQSMSLLKSLGSEFPAYDIWYCLMLRVSYLRYFKMMSLNTNTVFEFEFYQFLRFKDRA